MYVELKANVTRFNSLRVEELVGIRDSSERGNYEII